MSIQNLVIEVTNECLAVPTNTVFVLTNGPVTKYFLLMSILFHVYIAKPYEKNIFVLCLYPAEVYL